MPISPARVAAFEILMRVETSNAYASELLHSARFAELSPVDHGLTTELVMGVLRWRSVLDVHILAHSNKPPAKLDAEVITALRIGAYQLLCLDRVPAHAAINESVELVKRARKRSAAGMVNAVLRKISRPPEERSGPTTRSYRAQPCRIEEFQSRFLDSGERFANESSSAARNDSPRFKNIHNPGSDAASLYGPVEAHPAWMVERWTRNFGQDAAERICSHNQQTPSMVVRADDRLADEIENEGARLQAGKLVRSARAVISGDVAGTKAFRERRLVLQDEASQLVALLVGHGRSILDCCAAPGGKARILAEQNPKATVIALELHPHRARLLRTLVRENNVRVIAGDARAIPTSNAFDRILVDAPCSGTGTLVHNPEIKSRLEPEDLLRLQKYQLDILQGTMQHLAPGGRLVYSTCSLEPEENEQVVEQALSGNSEVRVVDCREELERLLGENQIVWENVGSLLSGPFLRTIPGVHPCDGFFAAILRRI